MEKQTLPLSCPFLCMDWIPCLFSLLKLFLRPPLKRPQASPKRPEGGQDPKGGKGRTGLLKLASPPSRAFVGLSVWSGRSVQDSSVPSRAVAVSESSPPRVRNGLSGEKFPCRVPCAVTGDWDQRDGTCVCQRLFLERCMGVVRDGWSLRSSHGSLKDGTSPRMD